MERLDGTESFLASYVSVRQIALVNMTVINMQATRDQSRKGVEEAIKFPGAQTGGDAGAMLAAIDVEKDLDSGGGTVGSI